MRFAVVASAAISTTVALTYFSLAESVNAQKILQKDKNFLSLPDQSSNSDLRNKQRYDYDSDRYDRDWNDRNRYDGGQRSQYYDEINRLYRQVLGRNADYDGLRTWSRELQRGRSLSYVRRELAYSQEAENTINNIYRRVLGRNVDRNGLRTWQSELARGKSLREVERSIARSPEARNKR
ncbi:DUF4214 domain-containing protein [Phormidium sp. LEGE 05292]|uniref:DUF4214 domain-containing protein n=1 Tax=[Phormidium] sp. LEGE 05292 TaxID=767427 RepID=UPI0018801C85|nr:DUF4214 domain-containing protein [Phormidium sp. LEGE 05292]MBE9225934.1 DUF4214 domain-containing protein [Phormidium sp. LEGE 05292]